MIRYEGTPTSPLSVSSDERPSSDDTLRLSSSLMTSATTFLPAQLTGSRPGAFQVDLNFVLAAVSVATTSTAALNAPKDRSTAAL
jgi:hypothetical protein